MAQWRGSGPGQGPASGGALRGVIQSYNPERAYGFIRCPSRKEDVYFHRHCLPKNMQAMHTNELSGKEVEFLLNVTPDNKDRCERMWPLHPAAGDPPSRDGGNGSWVPERRQGHTPQDYDYRDRGREHHLPPAAPPASYFSGAVPLGRDGREREKGKGKGKGGGKGAEKGGKGAPSPPLDDAVVADMKKWLEEKGGVVDHGKFANQFPGLKKSQLENHFNLEPEDRRRGGGRWQIMLGGVQPLTPEERVEREARDRADGTYEAPLEEAAAPFEDEEEDFEEEDVGVVEEPFEEEDIAAGEVADADAANPLQDVEAQLRRIEETVGTPADKRAWSSLMSQPTPDALEVLANVDALVREQGGRCGNLSAILCSECGKLEKRRRAEGWDNRRAGPETRRERDKDGPAFVEEEQPVVDDDPPLEPSSTLRLLGRVEEWDDRIGSGVVRVEGHDAVLVARVALPGELQSRKKLDLAGCELTFELDMGTGGELQARNVHMLLQPDGDGGWQLRRS